MVHQTIAISSNNASKASSKIQSMNRFLGMAAIVGMLAGCGSVPLPPPEPPVRIGPGPAMPSAPAVSPPSVAVSPALAADTAPLPAPLLQGRSRWTAVRWAELPGFADDALHEAWNAWLRSCERPGPVFAPLCPDVRRLSIATAEAQREWMVQRLQPYRVEPLQGSADGLLTGYYEPVLQASRLPAPGYTVPLYAPPAGLALRKPWYSRQDIDTLPAAKSALRGREIAWLADPLDALMLQIQGSGRLRITEPDGSVRVVRLAYAATNDHPYRSVGGWLLQQGAVRDASWPGIKAWAAQNPHRLNEMLWSNPRTVFFREESLSDLDAVFGPRGAQGVALTPGRSIAVDKESIPYGTPVWLASAGPLVHLQRLVLAQDTGSAITGAVRADYFAGWGPEAGELAGRLKQPLRLWVLWPRS